jgi:hypothetical protein
VQAVGPQDVRLRLLTQAVPQRCEPAAHGKVQAPAEQVAIVFAGTGVQSLLVQQLALAMQALPHILKPPAQGLLQVLAAPHEAVVFGGPAGQSACVQQPADGMHRLVPGQGLKPMSHEIPQAPPEQIAAPCAAGAMHALHPAPHALLLVSD